MSRFAALSFMLYDENYRSSVIRKSNNGLFHNLIKNFRHNENKCNSKCITNFRENILPEIDIKVIFVSYCKKENTWTQTKI